MEERSLRAGASNRLPHRPAAPNCTDANLVTQSRLGRFLASQGASCRYLEERAYRMGPGRQGRDCPCKCCSTSPAPWFVAVGRQCSAAAWLRLLTLLGQVQPAQAQVMSPTNLRVFNSKLAGRVVDHTHNHGHDHRLFSPILGMPRDLYVYLPPGYSPDKAYPLILYLHLATIDEHMFVGTSFLVQLDRMIQRGEFPPVVVACPDGSIGGENWLSDPHSFYVNGCHGRFQDHLTQEVLPYLMQCYSIRPEREAHASFGLSAGASVPLDSPSRIAPSSGRS